MKRFFAIFLTAVLLLGLLAGCAKDTAADSDTIGDSPMPKTRIEQLLSSISPEDKDYYQQLARFCVSDLIDHFWSGDEKTGYMTPVWQGFPTDLADERGAIWEAAEVLFNIYDLWVLTGEEIYKDYMIAEANYYKTNYENDLEAIETAGALLNTASDDCAWTGMLMLNFYTVTEDMWFVERAINILDDAYDRWYSDELGGGLWYKDGVDYKSLYEAGIALDWLRIWEITGEQRFYDLALASYEWMHTCLGRDDGIYACEATAAGHRGDAGRISEGGSSSFLGGNMAMAALSAKFYKITGEQKYLDRVYATNAGILQHYNNNGVLLNDRDAWTNGTFAGFYATWVLSLPNTEEMQQLLKDTAVSIVTNDRTADGYYGGSWQGPPAGPSSIWASNGSVAQQTMTSGTTVAIVVGAALLEAGIQDYVR